MGALSCVLMAYCEPRTLSRTWIGALCSQVENSFTVLLEDISRLRSDPDTADFVLRTSKGSRVFPVHKAILASRSNVFRTMFVSNMVEATACEAVIEDLDEETLEEMIHFLYTGGLSGSRYDIVSLCYAARKG